VPVLDQKFEISFLLLQLEQIFLFSGRTGRSEGRGLPKGGEEAKEAELKDILVMP
jgi:hypothetical protein